MDTNEALTRVLTAIERLADQIAELDARLSALEDSNALRVQFEAGAAPGSVFVGTYGASTEHGDEMAGGIPDWARQDYFCGER